MKRNKLRIILVMLCAFSALALQAQKNVTGTVVDQSGNGLPGVSIFVKGTNKGTTTDIDGKFGVSVPDGNTVLRFTFLGFGAVEQKVDLKKPMTVVMKETAKDLNGSCCCRLSGSSSKRFDRSCRRSEFRRYVTNSGS